LSPLTHDIAPFSLWSDTLSLPDGSLSLTFLPDGSLSLRFWLNNCAVFVPFTRPFGSKTLTSYTMAWKGLHPVVELVTTPYATGVTLTKEAMTAVEAQVTRLRDLDKWFVDIPYVPEDLRDA